jgi:hypothetical protein
MGNEFDRLRACSQSRVSRVRDEQGALLVAKNGDGARGATLRRLDDDGERIAGGVAHARLIVDHMEGAQRNGLILMRGMAPLYHG